MSKISENWIAKGSSCDVIRDTVPEFSLEGLRTTTKDLCQDSRSPGRDLKLAYRIRRMSANHSTFFLSGRFIYLFFPLFFKENSIRLIYYNTVNVRVNIGAWKQIWARVVTQNLKKKNSDRYGVWQYRSRQLSTTVGLVAASARTLQASVRVAVCWDALIWRLPGNYQRVKCHMTDGIYFPCEEALFVFKRQCFSLSAADRNFCHRN
jgi:hypothetical protein